MHDDDDDLDIAEIALPPEINDLAVPVPLNRLFPWHKPRKQFIREKQWLKFAGKMVAKLSPPLPLVNGSPKPEFRYLTLAGIDYFDVKVLGDVCNNSNCVLNSTSFLSGSNSTMARAKLREEELAQSGIISQQSMTFPHPIEDVRHKKSQTYRELRRRAPFHAVNIDACGSIAGPNAALGGRLIDAIHDIIALQLESATFDWILFVTTDARPENVSPAVVAALKLAILENANESLEFRNAALVLLESDNDDITAALDAASVSEDKFLTLFTLGLSKWLLHNCQQHNWVVECLAHYCYSTEGGDNERATMPCLAFKFKRNAPPFVDVYNVVPHAPPPAQEVPDYSMMALERSREMINLDIHLRSDADLRRTMATRAHRLLQEAGYEDAALAEYQQIHWEAQA